jgi:cell division protein ZapA (FtsZ GTPase activity inhibitor)
MTARPPKDGPGERKAKVRVAGVSIDAPVYGSAAQTEKLAERVTERMLEFEKKASRIDTQAFAILTALSFAAELHEQFDAADLERSEMKRDHQREVSDLVVQLEKVQAALRGLTEEFAVED